MKIKYALVKVLMLVGDVRNAMVAMGTSGTKDVLAHFDDDAYKRRTKCFDLYSALPGRKVICTSDDLSENDRV
jgi:hypothetical protein